MHESDERLGQAYMLLYGYVSHNKYGLPQHKYLKEGSEDGFRARMAIASLLREAKVNRELLNKLAALFDPRNPVLKNGKAHAEAHLIADRQLVFRHRNRGVSRDDHRNTHIFDSIGQLVQSGVPVGEAQIKIAAKF